MNVGVVEGGTTPNVVAAQATARVDVRISNLQEARRIEEAMRGLRAVLPGARVAVDGQFNRPPMERSPQVAALFEQARTIGRSLGLELEEGSTGAPVTATSPRPSAFQPSTACARRGRRGRTRRTNTSSFQSLPERAALLASLLAQTSPRPIGRSIPEVTDMEPEIATIRKASATPADLLASRRAERSGFLSGNRRDGHIVPVATLVGEQGLLGGLVLAPSCGTARRIRPLVRVSWVGSGAAAGPLLAPTGVVPAATRTRVHRRPARRPRLPRFRTGRRPARCIAWAFDPLQAGNARFNLDKLGAAAGRYVENMYGLRTDALNAGTPTDRLIVTWETEPVTLPSIAVEEARDLPRLIEAELRPDALLKVVARNATPESPWALPRCPRGDPSPEADRRPRGGSLGRIAVREAFPAASSPRVSAPPGFLRLNTEGPDRAFYLMNRCESRQVETKSTRGNEPRAREHRLIPRFTSPPLPHRCKARPADRRWSPSIPSG